MTSVPPLCLPFALLGLVLAQVTMAAVGVNTYDHSTYVWGLGFCALLAALLGTVRVTPAARRWLTLGAGMLAGVSLMSLAALPLILRYESQAAHTSVMGLLMIGASVGAVPAIALAAVDAITAARGLPSADARERTMTPFVIVCALVAAMSTGPLISATHDDAEIATLVTLLSLLALTEIAFRDRAHAHFLARVFEGAEPGYEVVGLAAPRSDVPLAVGGVASGALVMRHAPSSDYRSAASHPIYQTAIVLPLALEPLHKRGRLIVLAQAVTMVVQVVSVSSFRP